MSVPSVASECYILALFIRDDGKRFLLGSGAYEFKESQQQFSANSFVNDTIDVQGTDGTMLAGQVRRAGTQSFDGYVGDATVTKSKVEEYRRAFISFFAKNHFYKVVYIFPDGTSIKRQRGFIVDAPVVEELYQIHPEYHVALNFEDVNYYTYDEDIAGQEIFAQSFKIARIEAAQGGLVFDALGVVWDALGTVSKSASGVNITISDAVAGALQDVQLFGQTEQTAYSGKNLFDIDQHSSGFAPNTSASVVGDNTVRITTTNAGVNRWFAFPVPNPSALLGKTVTVSTAATRSGSNSGRVSLYFANTSSNSLTALIKDGSDITANGDVSTTATIASAMPSGSNAIVVLFYAATSTSGAVGDYADYGDVQLEVGSSATSYEPYVGGTASPNPDYPQAVQTATGRQVVKIGGKNIFDKDTMGLDGLYINLGNWTMGSGSNFGSAYAPCEPNTAYTISKTLTSRFAVGTSSAVPTSGVSITEGLTNPSKTDLTITTPADAKYIVVFLRSSSDSMTLAKILDTLQIEKGSEATAYEAYLGVEYEINLGKNLFDKDDTSMRFPGYISWNGIAGGESYLRQGSNDYCFCIPCETNTTYTLRKAVDPTTSANRFRVASAREPIAKDLTLYNTTGTGGGAEDSSITYTTDADAKYLVFYCWYTSGTLTVDEMAASIQIEKGSTATDYAPYFNPIELCQIGEYQDKIYKDGGKWYLEKQIGSQTLDGTENWDTRPTAGSSTIRRNVLDWTGVNVVRPASNYSNPTELYCEFYATETGEDTNQQKVGIAIMQSGWLAVYDTNYNSTSALANYKTWLAANTPTIYYPLSTPTTTQITNSALVAQLEALLAAKLAAGYNTIDAESVDMPTWLEVEYLTASEDDDAGGAVWEEGGDSGVQTINVDAIADAYPVITITGPAMNPAIENLTTGTTMSYIGTITAGQELVIDTMAQTAKLNGVNVVQNLYGGWLYFTPGTNRVSYSTTNTDAPEAEGQFSEVVG